ncbi:MAG: endonuclease [Bacteriodetes bacterium]|nr:endonuclease [Bacteroidota bacterium]
MKKSYAVILIVFISTLSIQAQVCSVSTNKSEFEFNNQKVGAMLDIPFEITNTGNKPLFINDIKYVNSRIYNDISVRFHGSTNDVVIVPQSSLNLVLEIHFNHNVVHNGYIQFTTSCGCREQLHFIPIKGNTLQNSDVYFYTTNLEYDSLYSALQAKVVNHNSLTYKPAREVMFGKADNIRDSVECIYTGRKLKTAGIPPNGEFNTEHTWPQSYGSSNEPNKSDINHLYPTYPNANSIRANYPFGKVITVWKDAGGGSKLGFTAKGDTVFEPRDISKGNIARSIFYYMVRYGNLMNYYTTPYSMDADLRLWNRADPPDDKELRRCDTIAAYQGKRNPFVDFPELVERLEFVPANHKNDVGVTTNVIVFAPENKDTLQCVLYNKWKDTTTVTSVFLTDTTNFTTDVKVGDVLTPHTLRIVNITYTKVSPQTLRGRTYLVSGYGNGKYDTLEFDNCAINPVKQEQQPVQTQVRPQPFDNTATVECSLRAEDITRVALYSIDGREVYDITNRILPTNNGTTLHITKTDTQQYGRILVVRFYTSTSVVSQMVIAE